MYMVKKRLIRLLPALLSLLIVFSSANVRAVQKGADVLYSSVAEEKGLTLGLASRELFNYRSELSWPDGPEIDAQGAYLIEINTGSAIYGKNNNEQFYPASITKILTALVTLEHCNDLDEMVTFSHNAIHDLEDGGYSWIAEEGDQLSVRDCLYALMLQSSNECAYALAEHVGGSVSAFCEMMNQKAKEVGATNSHFANPHGLTNSEHLTTPHDMACIMWAAIQNPEFLKIDSTITYRTAPTTTNKDGFFCTMRHSMMRNTEYHDDRVIAGKTGYISAAKNTLVTYAKDGDKELIAVVMCVNGTGQACIDTKKLLDYGFGQFEITPEPSGVELETIKNDIEQETGGRQVEGVSYDDSIDILHAKSVKVPELSWSIQISAESPEENEKKGELTFFVGEKVAAKRDFTATLKPEEEAAHSDDPKRQESDETQAKSDIPVQALLIAAAVILVIMLIWLIAAIRRRKRVKNREKGSSRKKR